MMNYQHALIDDDLKYLHNWIEFEEYYNNRKDKEEQNERNKIFKRDYERN